MFSQNFKILVKKMADLQDFGKKKKPSKTENMGRSGP